MMKDKVYAVIALPQVKQAVELAHKIFAADLQAIYLYGSAVVEGLRPYSDIDLLLITNRRMTVCKRKDLTQQLLQISGCVGDKSKRPLEVTVVCSADLMPFAMPPRCDYMYGEWLRDEMENGVVPQPFADADNDVLLWQARRHSHALYGEPAEKVLPPIPFTQIQKAILESLPALISGLDGDERNVLLTMARMWYTLAKENICSKNAAAAWAKPKLPAPQAAVLEQAQQDYLNGTEDLSSTPLADIKQLAELLAAKIKQFKADL